MANQFIIPSRILIGEQALEQGGGILKKMGNKALIVTDQTMVRLKNVAELETVLKREHL